MDERIRDVEMVRDTVEQFLIDFFGTTEMSGSVYAERKNIDNFLSVYLKDLEWDEDLLKLHRELVEYLKNWVKDNDLKFDNLVSISKWTIQYKLSEKKGENMDQFKFFRLLNISSLYNGADQNVDETSSKFKQSFSKFWNNILLRNAILLLIPVIALVIFSIYKIYTDCTFEEKIMKSYENVNIATGIISSFILGFIIDKVITVRQDKLKYTREIRKLSNLLTYFRSICFNLKQDHVFWTEEKEFHKAYNYAEMIKKDITYEEYNYPNYKDKVKYAKYKSLYYREDEWHSVVLLVLQLEMMADHSFLDSGLFYTDFPSDYFYTHGEMQNFVMFSDNNLIWYCSSELKIFPKNFENSHRVQRIIADINRIYPDKRIDNLSCNVLEDVSLDFQYSIIPRLFKLTRLVELQLSGTVRYFVKTVSLLLVFGLILPTLSYLFIGAYAFVSVFGAIGIIAHILLTIRPILDVENTLDPEIDYL